MIRSYVKVDLNGLLGRIQQRGERAVKGVSTVMQEGGDEIRDLARMYAPVDKGNLEDAIIKSTNPTGLNRRAEIEVGVDMSQPIGGGRTVERYAERMHEGNYKLGKKSEAKAAALGVRVGPGYLSRAFNEVKGKMIERAANIVKRAYSK